MAHFTLGTAWRAVMNNDPSMHTLLWNLKVHDLASPWQHEPQNQYWATCCLLIGQYNIMYVLACIYRLTSSVASIQVAF